MVNLIIGIVLTVGTIGLVVSRVVLRRQTVQQAVEKLAEALRTPGHGNLSGEVFAVPHRLYPLSEEMIKEAALMRGYQFEVVTLHGNTRRLRFRHDPDFGRKGTRYGG